MTLATQRGRYMGFFLESCRRCGIAPVVLGRGRRWAGFGLKLRLLREALDGLRGRGDIVLYTDAHDSLILGSPAELLARFEVFGRPLVFSAERNCWPDASRASSYPPAGTPWRYLNAGGFIGEASALREQVGKLGRRIPGALDDQRWWTDRLLEEPGAIHLDSRCELFQTLFDSLDDLKLARRLSNRVTGTHPLVIHANGWVDMWPVLFWYKRRLGR